MSSLSGEKRHMCVQTQLHSGPASTVLGTCVRTNQFETHVFHTFGCKQIVICVFRKPPLSYMRNGSKKPLAYVVKAL